jgi:hypothetical protein
MRKISKESMTEDTETEATVFQEVDTCKMSEKFKDHGINWFGYSNRL